MMLTLYSALYAVLIEFLCSSFWGFYMENDTKVGRTVRLTSGVNQRLLDLCEHLGVNPNAYLVAEVGKAVARDELSLMVKGHSDNMFASLNRLITEQEV